MLNKNTPLNNNKEVIKSSKKYDDLLPIVLKEIFKLLSVNPTIKYIIEKTGKDKRIVSRDIKRLINLGFVKRIDRGIYKIIIDKKSHQDNELLTSSHQEYWRLHKLEVCLKITSEQHNIIKSEIFKNKQHYKLRNFGHVGHYFELESIGMITKENVFMEFQSGWEIKCETYNQVGIMMYQVIEQTAQCWEDRFKINIFKDGKINFDIRDMHFSYINGELVREFKKSNIKGVIVKDDNDGKARFIIDWSKNKPEIEFIHPEKALTDGEAWDFFLKRMANGDVKQIFDDRIDLKTMIIQNNLLVQYLIKKEYIVPKKEVVEEENIQEKPFYVG